MNDETKLSTSNRLLAPVGYLFNKLVPPYEPKIEIETKLVGTEQAKQHAVILHFSELQLLLGLILVPLGFALRRASFSIYVHSLTILGILLLLTAYEMEEIYITTHRIMIRRVGIVERILRIPSDEEHALEHLVSFQIGRAPVNMLLLPLSLPGFLILLDDRVPDLIQLAVVMTSVVILMFALRINRRAVTLFLAGGHNIILGTRKGVPKRIIEGIQRAIYEDHSVSKKVTISEEGDLPKSNEETDIEKPAKEIEK